MKTNIIILNFALAFISLSCTTNDEYYGVSLNTKSDYDISYRFNIGNSGNGCIVFDQNKNEYYFLNNRGNSKAQLTITDFNGNIISRDTSIENFINHPNDVELYDKHLYICDVKGVNNTMPSIKKMRLSDNYLVDEFNFAFIDGYKAAGISINSRGTAYITMVQAKAYSERAHFKIISVNLDEKESGNFKILSSFSIPCSRIYCQGTTIVDDKFLFITENSGGRNSMITIIDIEHKIIIDRIDLKNHPETEGITHIVDKNEIIIEFQNILGELHKLVYSINSL